MKKRTLLLVIAIVVAVVLSFGGAGATLKCYSDAGNPNGDTYDPDNNVEKRTHIDIDLLPGPYAMPASSKTAAPDWKICLDEEPQ